MVKARRFVAAAILGTYAALHGVAAWTGEGAARFCWAFFSIACLVGAVTMVRPAWWARRFSKGIALAGLLNCAAYFAFFRDLGGISLGLVQVGAFATLFVLLLGKKMRITFDERATHWKFDHATMHVLAAALSLNVAGIGMLVYYACLGMNDSLRASALCLAALMSVGSIMSARGLIAGLFAMTLAGAASIWLGVQAFDASPMCSWGNWEAVKSIAGFAPAALGSLLCFGVFLGPMVRFVRNQRG
jgi:hypothetical protein